MPRPSLYLIDGYALIYRAFFALIRNPLRTSSGEETSAPFGMANFLVKLLDERKPDHIGVVLDSRERTFRHERFADYKATREKMPDDLSAQLPRVHELFQAFRVPIIEIPGQEADDVIGSLARKAADAGLEVTIVSGDKDFYQLVDDHIRLLNPGRGGPGGVDEEVVDLTNAREKFGVPPGQVTDVLGFMGDSSDNVPGVAGIGPKSAQKLVEDWGSMEDVYANLDDVGTPKMRERLAAGREAALLSKDLVTIRTDLDVELDLEALAVRTPAPDLVTTLFTALEFTKLLERFGGGAEVTADAEYAVVDTMPALEALVAEIRRAGRVAVGVETDPPNPIDGEIVGFSLATAPGRARYVPVGHAGDRNLPHDRALDILVPVLQDPAIRKVGQDLKFDTLVLQKAGIELAGVEADAILAAYILDPGRRAYGIDLLALEHLGHKMISYDEVTRPDGENQIPFPDVDVESAARYACEDADVSFRLCEMFLPQLEARELMDLYRGVELPLIPVLAEMERAGIKLNAGFFAAMGAKLEGELAAIERDCHAIAGGEFNLNSPQQLAEILFERLKLPVIKRTKTGYSTDAEVLEALAVDHELPRRCLEWRELAKLKSTYVDALPAAVNPRTGKLHTSFNQTVAASGRLSSSEPNLQNIPARTALGREIRKGFIPSEEGWTLLVADYSQIELRILAHLTGDPNLVLAFRTGQDIHRQTAALVFGVAPEKVNEMLRTRAKEVNFGVVYGMGVFGLARRLGITREEAKAFIDGYFARFADVRRYQEDTIEKVKQDGYVTTLLGRRRYLPEIRSRNFNVRSFAERAAINSPIQGTAADLLKIAMIRVRDRIARDKLPARMLLTVHDELVFEVERSAADALGRAVRTEMEGAIELDVPVEVGVGTGDTWYDAK
ncbi:MAG TPA: DNA polymerase I [Gemmatimonadota bacterium]|nr:DNA polymerase I [Gemmatimonadota bacterium]